MDYPQVINSFVKFHIYFSVRRILYELSVPLPDDPVFNVTNNPYNKVSYHTLCRESVLPNNPDFRWKGARNHGLGDIFINHHGSRPGCGDQNLHLIRGYDTYANTWPAGINTFLDEGAKREHCDLISFKRNDDLKGFNSVKRRAVRVSFSYFCFLSFFFCGNSSLLHETMDSYRVK